MEKQRTPLAIVRKELDKVILKLISESPELNSKTIMVLEELDNFIISLEPTEREAYQDVYVDGCLENIDATKPIEYGAYFDSKFTQS